MTDTTSDRVSTALRYRKLAVDDFNAAQAHYEIAVLDHVTARIADAYPEATHLTFDHRAHDRTITLHGLLTTHHGGTEDLILDARRDTDTALDLSELTDDLSDALAGPRSAAWSAVRPAPRPDRRRVLDLPPVDRAVRIAELVRAQHPQAGLITVDFASDTCKVLDVICTDIAEAGQVIIEQRQADEKHPLWSEESERQISALTLQIHALPHLRAQYLVRVGGPAERTAVLLPPQTETGKE
jgi:hypothetical protein